MHPLQTWILIPIAYFGNTWGSPTYDIMSNTLYTKNGTDYPFQSLREPLFKSLLLIHLILPTHLPITASRTDGLKVYTDSAGNQQVNETRYEEVGLSYAGAQYTWGIFMVCSTTVTRPSHTSFPSICPISRCSYLIVVCLIHFVVCLGRAVPCAEDVESLEEQERSGKVSH